LFLKIPRIQRGAEVLKVKWPESLMEESIRMYFCNSLQDAGVLYRDFPQL